MNIRFLSPRLHGVVDYAAAAGLIVLPFALGLGGSAPLAFWLSVGSGVTVIGYSLLTSYAYSAAPVLPFRLHLLIDFAAAVAFAVAPFVFGFAGVDAVYYWVMAAAVLVVVAVSQDSEADRPAVTTEVVPG